MTSFSFSQRTCCSGAKSAKSRPSLFCVKRAFSSVKKSYPLHQIYLVNKIAIVLKQLNAMVQIHFQHAFFHYLTSLLSGYLHYNRDKMPSMKKKQNFYTFCFFFILLFANTFIFNLSFCPVPSTKPKIIFAWSVLSICPEKLLLVGHKHRHLHLLLCVRQ